MLLDSMVDSRTSPKMEDLASISEVPAGESTSHKQKRAPISCHALTRLFPYSALAERHFKEDRFQRSHQRQYPAPQDG